MHGNSFNAINTGTVVTVWKEGPYYGERGMVLRTHGKAIVIKLDMGHETTERYQDVAYGDNSRAHDL